MLFPVADNIHGSICLHVPLIYKKNNIDWLVLTPFSTYSYTPRAGAHKLDICDTMVCCHNLMYLALLRLDNFINWGNCPWCAHQHDTEYTKDHRDPPSQFLMSCNWIFRFASCAWIWFMPTALSPIGEASNFIAISRASLCVAIFCCISGCQV